MHGGEFICERIRLKPSFKKNSSDKLHNMLQKGPNKPDYVLTGLSLKLNGDDDEDIVEEQGIRV